MLNWVISSYPTLLLIEAMSSDLGIPVNCRIFSSCYVFDPPIKSGSPIINSAKIQPILQTSVAQSYSSEPKSIYGDLYHLVATSSDKTSSYDY
jgi:hypothetical protein